MTNETENLAESIRSGRYFENSRSWYQAMFIGPVGERTLFLLIAVLAAIVALIALLSLSSLLPVTSRVPVVVYAHDNPDNYMSRLIKLRERKGDVNEAIASFYVQQYVVSREAYDSKTFLFNSAFIKSQSDASVYETYQHLMGLENPSSPIRLFGRNGARAVQLTAFTIKPSDDGGSAVVQFIDEVTGTGAPPQQSRWTAKLEYKYKALVADSTKDPETGIEKLNVEDPQFQVVSYVVEKNS